MNKLGSFLLKIPDMHNPGHLIDSFYSERAISQKAMFSLLSKQIPGLSKQLEIIGISDILLEDSSDLSLEKQICLFIKNFDFKNCNDEDLITIFHLINIWSGSSSRWIYIKENFDQSFIRDIYFEFCYEVSKWDFEVNSALKIVTLLKPIRMMNIPMITKHLRFWSIINLKDKNHWVPCIFNNYSRELVFSKDRGPDINSKISMVELFSLWTLQKKITLMESLSCFHFCDTVQQVAHIKNQLKRPNLIEHELNLNELDFPDLN